MVLVTVHSTETKKLRVLGVLGLQCFGSNASGIGVNLIA